jgi:hypothetical protein
MIYAKSAHFQNTIQKHVLFNLKGTESNRPLEAQSAILRRFFMDLTQSFMIPLVTP